MFSPLSRLFGTNRQPEPESDEPRYFTIDQIKGDIQAAMDSGEIVPWRRDPITGEQWYRRRPRLIRGVKE